VGALVPVGPWQVLAVDVPSGLSADTGQPLGVAVRAAATVTFGLPKIGLCLPPGNEYAGQLRVADIGLCAPGADEERPTVEVLEAPAVGTLLPRAHRAQGVRARSSSPVRAGSWGPGSGCGGRRARR
jgi:NAD(P)H-hydrate epimerase